MANLQIIYSGVEKRMKSRYDTRAAIALEKLGFHGRKLY
jgi:hypothetical protein